MTTNWRDVPGYGGLYLVSDDGQIQTVKTGLIRKLCPRDDKYVQINLLNKQVGRNFLVHRLVAAAFVENPTSKPDVNHKDGNRANNVASNLEWVTRSENSRHSYAVLKRQPAKAIGSRNKFAKLTELDAQVIKLWRLAGYSYQDIATVFPVTDETIRRVCVGDLWAHVPA